MLVGRLPMCNIECLVEHCEWNKESESPRQRFFNACILEIDDNLLVLWPETKFQVLLHGDLLADHPIESSTLLVNAPECSTQFARQIFTDERRSEERRVGKECR